MGGSQGARGYLYQTYVAVFDLLSEPNWDAITIEPDTDGDKVDVKIQYKDQSKVIQVKSSCNPFGLKKVSEWCDELNKTTDAKFEKELVLIGNYTDKLEESTQQGNPIIIKGVTIRIYSFNQDALKATMYKKLHHFLCEKNVAIDAPACDAMCDVLVSKGMDSSITSERIARCQFEEKLLEYVNSVFHSLPVERKAINLKSVSRHSGDSLIPGTVYRTLDLREFFEEDGHVLKKGYSWEHDVIPDVVSFFESLPITEKYQLYFSVGLSLSFLVGAQLDSTSPYDIVPMQRTHSKLVPWDAILGKNTKNEELDISEEEGNGDSDDTILIISLTRDIKTDVMNYLSESGIGYGKTILVKPKNSEIGSCSISDGTQCNMMASYLGTRVNSLRNQKEKRARLHIFASAPNTFMFRFGQNSKGLGTCCLYEYLYQSTYEYQQAFEKRF